MMRARTLQEWLENAGLERHLEVLQENQVDLDVLADLDDDDLKELGLSLGDRKRFLSALARDQTQLASTDTVDEGAVASGRAAAAQPERRLLTVLFCDIVDSTQLAINLDPEDMGAVVAACRSAVAEAVTQHGGTIAQFLGDGILAYFGYPHASEHDAERAVRAGLEAASSVNQLVIPKAARIAARVGIATGEVVVGEQIGLPESAERLAIGTTPNLAARLQAVAAPGEVVVAAETQRHVGRMFEYRDLGRVQLKGIDAPAEAFVVLGELTAVTRFEARQTRCLAPLVGRDEDAERLMRRWRSSVSGSGQVVFVSGEAGIGKSRLVQWLLDALDGEEHSVIRHFGSPHHTRSPLKPAIGQLEHAAGFERGDTGAEKLNKLVWLLGRVSGVSETDIGLMAELLSLPAEDRFPVPQVDGHQKRELTLNCLIGQLKRTAEARAAVLIVEDAHWMDPTSLDLLDRIIECVPEWSLMVVVTARPPFQPTWIGEPHVTSVNLTRLSRHDVGSLITSVAGKSVPDDVCRLINARAEGIPLFVEEITNALLESGRLRETTAAFEHDGDLPELAVPNTLRATLVARLDRLSEARSVAQMGAAIGRNFTFDMLAALIPHGEVELRPALAKLVEAGLLTCRGVIPAAVFSFKHALVQDAAYSTLLHSQRRELHAAIANVMVERDDGMADEQPEVVAHHFMHAEMPLESFHHWRHAGLLAFERSALREAEGLYRQSLEMLALVEKTPETRALAVDVRVEMRMVYAMLGEVRDALTVLQVANTIADVMADQSRLGVVSGILANGHSLVGDLDKAVVFAKRALNIAKAQNDSNLRFMTTTYLENTCYLRGEYEDVAQLADENLAALPEDRVDEFIGLPIPSPIYDRCWRVLSLAHLGRFAEAEQPAEQGLALAIRSPRPIAKSVAHFANATLRMVKGDWEGALLFAQDWVDVDRRSHIVLHLPWSVTSLAWVRAELGQDAQALCAEGEELLRDHEERGVVGYICWAYTALARAALACADPHAAERLAARALHSSPNHKGFYGYALHLWGDMLSAPSMADFYQAERYLSAALALSRERKMIPLEAHCHASLARVCEALGDERRAASEREIAERMYTRAAMRPLRTTGLVARRTASVDQPPRPQLKRA